MIKIQLKLDLFQQPIPIEVEKGTTLEAIAKEYQSTVPFRILGARVNNELKELNRTVETDSEIVFLDLRIQAANQMYQRSVSFVYLKAVKDVFGDVETVINNSLNKGLFTEIRLDREIDEDEVWAVEDRMREIVNANLPFTKEIVSKDTAYEYLIEDGHREKIRMLESAPDVDQVAFYTLDGFRDYFYGPMVPSTDYVQIFELRKYKKGVLLRLPQQASPNKIPDYVDEPLLYDAFADARDWARLMEINFVVDLNKIVKSDRCLEMIQLSEALHEKDIARIADKILRSGKRIVLIAGPSSSGKTTFARRLNIQLKVNGLDPLYLGTDDYFVNRKDTPLDENGEYNFEDLDAVDIELFNNNMNALLRGEEVDLPTYDFLKGEKIFGLKPTKISADRPVVIEGIHALNNALSVHIDNSEKFKIYISPLTQLNIDDHNRIPTTDVRMLRRIIRDYRTRGHSVERTIALWPKVRIGENRNIFPYNSEADVFFNSVHIYELAVLKKYAEPLLKSVSKDDSAYSEAYRLLKFLAYFEQIEDDSVIVNNSILREFIGGSIFV